MMGAAMVEVDMEEVEAEEGSGEVVGSEEEEEDEVEEEDTDDIESNIYPSWRLVNGENGIRTLCKHGEHRASSQRQRYRSATVEDIARS